jgi:glycosyltransferase involved in cell wall biosynthesis
MLTSAPFPPEEGIGNYIFNLSMQLLKRGHAITVITRGGLKSESFCCKSIRVIRTPFLMAYPFHVDINGVFVNKLLRECETDFDLLHLHMPLVPAVSTSLPIITTFHSPQFVDAQSIDVVNFRGLLLKILGRFDLRIEKSLIKSSGVVSAVSSGVKLDLERYYPVEPKKIRIFGNGVPHEYLNAAQTSSIERDPSSVLFVGRLEHGKGLLDLIRSMKIVTKKIPNARLVIVGKGPLLNRLKKTIVKLEVSNNIQLKGFHSPDEVLKDYLHASIFVLPSHVEGLATVILEAMACRVPVVATNVRGISEIVESGKTGLLVPKKDPLALANAIIRLLEHPDIRQDLAKSARRLIKEEFTWEKVTDRVVEAYLTAIK